LIGRKRHQPTRTVQFSITGMPTGSIAFAGKILTAGSKTVKTKSIPRKQTFSNGGRDWESEADRLARSVTLYCYLSHTRPHDACLAGSSKSRDVAPKRKRD
jgi:hypothetical protein